MSVRRHVGSLTPSQNNARRISSRCWFTASSRWRITAIPGLLTSRERKRKCPASYSAAGPLLSRGAAETIGRLSIVGNSVRGRVYDYVEEEVPLKSTSNAPQGSAFSAVILVLGPPPPWSITRTTVEEAA